jgi:hypothetical protein
MFRRGLSFQWGLGNYVPEMVPGRWGKTPIIRSRYPRVIEDVQHMGAVTLLFKPY